MLKMRGSYEHFNPEDFGNERAFPISGQSGRAAISMKLASWGYRFGKRHPVVDGLMDDIRGSGYIGDSQFYLMFSRYDGVFSDPLQVDRIDVMDSMRDGKSSPEAIVSFRSNGHRFYEVSGGDGQVDAVDRAMRKALRRIHPEIGDVRLLSYTVPPITGTGADASVQVRVYMGNGEEMWDSVREGTDLVAASADALADAYRFFLLRKGEKNR
jgi:2-isopropylmalate synthase